MKSQSGWRFLVLGQILLSNCLLSIVVRDEAKAQIIPDTTLPTNSTIQVNGDNLRILQGTEIDNRLFHSFTEFNINNNQTVIFNNPVGIDHILTRVTGTQSSKIEGTLGVNGNANFFLFNPNGIMFGKNADLNLNGAFFASTAREVLIEDNWVNIATANSESLLKINPNVLFNYGLRNYQGDISFNNLADKLATQNNDLLLSARNINFNNVDVVTGTGNIILEATNILSLRESVIETNIRFEDGKFQDGGNIMVNADTINLEDNSALQSIIENTPNFTPNLPQLPNLLQNNSLTGGNIILNSQNLNLTNGSRLSTTNKFTVNFGNQALTQREKSLQFESLQNRLEQPIDIFGGNIRINSSQSVQIKGGDNRLTGITTEVRNNRRSVVGNSGDIRINTNLLSVNFGQINASTNGIGNAGNININSLNKVSVMGNGNQGQSVGIASLVDNLAVGQTGNIIINTDHLEVSNVARITNSTLGIEPLNQPKRIEINSNRGIHLFNNGAITSSVSNGFSLTPKQILIQTPSLTLDNGSIFAETDNIGSLGSILIDQAQSVILENKSSISTNIKPVSLIGINTFREISDHISTSNIQINTETLSIINSRIRSTSNAKNINEQFPDQINIDAGSIEINATESILIENNNPNVITGIISRVTKDTRGSGGNITIDPPLLEIKGDAQISTENRGDGIGGNIDIFAGILKLENQAEITSETFQATGGNISLNLGQYLFLQGGSNITTTAGKAISGGGNGGNITINSPFIIAIPNQDNNIIAEAFAGNGGNININSIALFGIRFTGENIPIRNDISASSQFGLNGTVIINTPDVDPTSGLIQLPLDTVSPTVVNQCQASRQNSFIMLGKGGIPSTPGDTFTDEVIIEDLAEIPLQPSTPQDNNQSSQLEQSQSQPPQIIQAQGWGMTAEGNILLTQSPVTVTPQTPQFNSGNCVQNE